MNQDLIQIQAFEEEARNLQAEVGTVSDLRGDMRLLLKH
jgi:hypothetical protein